MAETVTYHRRELFAESWATLLGALVANDPDVTDLRSQYCILDRHNYGPEHCKMLTQAFLANKHITSLKVADLPASACAALGEALERGFQLSSLTVHEACGLLDDEAGVAIVKGVMRSKTVHTLKLQGAFGPKTGLALMELLKQNTMLRSLALVGKFVTDAEGAIGEGLRQNKTLSTLRLVESGECACSGVLIAEALRHNRALKSVLIAFKSGGTAAVAAMAQALMVNDVLQTVAIICTNASGEAGVALRSALEKNSTLTNLRLCSNEMGSDVAPTIIRSLRLNRTLKFLSLECFAAGENSLGPTTCTAMVEVLRENKTLRTLKLVGDLKDQAIRALTGAVKDNKSLQTLSLMPRTIGAGCADAYEEMLAENDTLKSFTLSSMPREADGTDDEVGRAVAKGVRASRTLKCLKLAGCFGDGTLSELANTLKVNRSLESLVLNSNAMSDCAGQELGHALKSSVSLRSFTLECHHGFGGRLTDETGVAVAQALAKNKTLETLHLHGRGLTERTGEEMAAALRINQRLMSLRLHQDPASCQTTKEALAKALEFNASLRSLQVNCIDSLHLMGRSSQCDYDAAGYLLRNRVNAMQMGVIAPVARDSSDLGFACLQHKCLRRRVFEFLLPAELVDEFFAERAYIAKRPSSKHCTGEIKHCTGESQASSAQPITYSSSTYSTFTMDSLPGINKMLQTPQGYYSIDSLPSCPAASESKATSMDTLPAVRGQRNRDPWPACRPSQARTMDALPSMAQDDEEDEEEGEDDAKSTDEGMPVRWTASMPPLGRAVEEQFISIRAVTSKWSSRSLD